MWQTTTNAWPKGEAQWRPGTHTITQMGQETFGFLLPVAIVKVCIRVAGFAEREPFCLEFSLLFEY